MTRISFVKNNFVLVFRTMEMRNLARMRIKEWAQEWRNSKHPCRSRAIEFPQWETWNKKKIEKKRETELENKSRNEKKI